MEEILFSLNKDGGYCCYCLGPAYFYTAFDIGLAFKPFGGLPQPQEGWNCTVSWQDPQTGQIEFRSRFASAPDGYQFSGMNCFTGYFRCGFVEALQNDTFGYGGINGSADAQNGTTDWVTSSGLGRRNGCSENLSREECERCREVVNIETAQDYCGTFIQKAADSDSQCCSPSPLYDPNDKQNCIC
jgi:hypothetical protein